MSMRLSNALKKISQAHIAAVALALVQDVTIGVRSESAGAFIACGALFLFDGPAANIVPPEYVATLIDSSSAEDDWQARLQETAQRLSSLLKLDSWHQLTFGRLGVVAHIFLGRISDLDEFHGMLLARGASALMRKLQILVFLQGGTLLEDDQFRYQCQCWTPPLYRAFFQRVFSIY